MNFILKLFPVFMIVLYGCSENKFHTPASQLGHIDVILDNESFIQLTRDTFMTHTFSYVFYDTSEYGNLPSYDFFMVGQENFIHFSESKGFYQNQSGGMNLVFQTLKPDMQDSLKIAWKNFSSYALDENLSSGPTHALYEVFPLLNWSNIDKPRLIPFLSTYSAQTFKNMQLDYNGADMKSFLSAQIGPWIRRVLFRKITSVYLNATSREAELLRAALLVSGYKADGDKFTHYGGSADIYINIIEDESMKRINKFSVALSTTALFEKTFNRLKISLNGDSGWIIYE